MDNLSKGPKAMPAAKKGSLVTATAPIAATDTTAVTVSTPSSDVIELPDSEPNSDSDGDDSSSTTSMKKDPSSLVNLVVVVAFTVLGSLEVESLDVVVTGWPSLVSSVDNGD